MDFMHSINSYILSQTKGKNLTYISVLSVILFSGLIFWRFLLMRNFHFFSFYHALHLLKFINLKLNLKIFLNRFFQKLIKSQSSLLMKKLIILIKKKIFNNFKEILIKYFINHTYPSVQYWFFFINLIFYFNSN